MVDQNSRRFSCGLTYNFLLLFLLQSLLLSSSSSFSTVAAASTPADGFEAARNASTYSPQDFVLGEPPEWMTEPLFHSPRVFAADYLEMKQKLKLFIYPRSVNESRMFGHGGGEVLPRGNYASEHYFFRNLFESPEFITQDPEEAHFFVLPFSVFSVRMSIGPNAVSEWVAKYMQETLKQEWPYWKRSGGADHFYATCHDLGVQAAQKAAGLSGAGVQVICAADRWIKNFIPTKDFSFPQIWPRYTEAVPGGLSAAERETYRTAYPREDLYPLAFVGLSYIASGIASAADKASKVLAFWSGSQNSRVRAFLKRTWEDDDEILLGGGRVLRQQQRGEAYWTYFRKAKFCLHASGYQVYTCRIGDAIYFGCVPVILSDQYDLPFKDVLNWTEFAVIVVESQIPNLKTILKAIPDHQYEKMQKNVEKLRRLFIWNTPPQDYDIFHMIMYDLWLRRFTSRPALALK